MGVKEGKAVSVRGNANHPVNLGKLCPKGLSEHYTLEAENRAKYPLLRKNGKLVRVDWDEALGVMGHSATFSRNRPRSSRDSEHRQLVTEEFYTLGKLVQLGFGTKITMAIPRCAWPARCPTQGSFGSDGPPGA